MNYVGMKLVAERYEQMAGLNADDRMTTMMDLEVVEQNFGPIDWDKVVNMRDGDFAHDLFGIKQYIDRRSMIITDCFVPRFVGIS